MNITFRKTTKEDCKLLIDINNKAFYDDYIRYGECPGYNISIEKMLEAQKNPKIEKHIVYVDNIEAGCVSVHKLGNGKYYLGDLCVIPEYQHKGIGKLTIDFVLNNYEDLKELSLITPSDKIENVNFYTKKCGFIITGTEMDGKVNVSRFKIRR